MWVRDCDLLGTTSHSSKCVGVWYLSVWVNAQCWMRYVRIVEGFRGYAIYTTSGS